MNKFLHYINDVLESLDIPTITNSKPKKVKPSSKKHSKNSFLEEK